MPTLIPHPARIQAAGTKPKIIHEFVGRVNSGTAGVSFYSTPRPEGAEYAAICLPAFSPATVHRDG